MNQSTPTGPNEITDYIYIIIILILLRQYSNKKLKTIQYSKPEIKSLQLKETYWYQQLLEPKMYELLKMVYMYSIVYSTNIRALKSGRYTADTRYYQ